MSKSTRDAPTGAMQLPLLSSENSTQVRDVKIEAVLRELVSSVDQMRLEGQDWKQAVWRLQDRMNARWESEDQLSASLNATHALLKHVEGTVTRITNETTARLEPLIAALAETPKATQEGISALRSAQASFEQSAGRSWRQMADLVGEARNGIARRVESEVATVTASRREMWAEAARFREQIQSDLRWLIRMPMFVALATIMTFGLWVIRREMKAPSALMQQMWLDRTETSKAAPQNLHTAPQR
jgi:hypothetical protein